MKHSPVKPSNTHCKFQISICLFLCCLLLCVPSKTNAKIVYVYVGSIYVMNDNGSGIQRLTDNLFRESHPRWSPDGTQIAFERHLENDSQKYQLFIMNANGTNQRQLTHNVDGSKNGLPTWSPDGQFIAFSSNRSGRSEIYTINLQNFAVKQLTGIEEETGSHRPDWSLNGEEIVFVRFIAKPGLSHKGIWVMSADGKNQRPFLPDPEKDVPLLLRSYPQWMPDGRQILFIESRQQQDKRVKRFVIQHKGGFRKEIDINEKIGGRWVGSDAGLMEQGRAILFSVGRLDVPDNERFHDIYRYEIATGKLRKLTKRRYHNILPDWVEGPLPISPQGKMGLQWGDMKTRYSVEKP